MGLRAGHLLIQGLLAQAAALAAPPRCRACRAPCAAGEAICASCDAGLAALPPGPRAPRRGPALASHFAAFPMRGAARELVHALKYGGAAATAAEMARRIAERAPAGLFESALLVPAPAHPLHLRARGYNQSALLARELARLTGAAISDCLTRSPSAPPQTGLPRERRLALDPRAITVAAGATLSPGADRCGGGVRGTGGVRGARRAKRSSPHPTTNVLVLDDVATTGVTLELCASAISRRTAAPVGAVTFAATGARPGQTRSRSPAEGRGGR